MRIAHICVANFYIDNAGYQENLLVRQHVNSGHDVKIFASTENHDERGRLTYVKPTQYLGADGAQVLRLPYVPWLPHRMAKKLRIHPNLLGLLTEFKPEAILFHGASGYEIRTVSRYVKENPDVKLYVDSHADRNNSARGFLSRILLHRGFYRYHIQKALPQVEKVLCVSTEAMDFAQIMYGIPVDYLEFFPLGGFPISDGEWARRRKQKRAELNIQDDERLILQSGKMTRRKKLIEALVLFQRYRATNLRFLIAGVLTDEVKDEVEQMIRRDPRIRFIGWQSTEELTSVICASDMYIQPGTQSATMQHALCCGCPVAIDNVPAHQAYKDAGVILLNSVGDLENVFSEFTTGRLNVMREQAKRFAEARLDYKVLSERILR